MMFLYGKKTVRIKKYDDYNIQCTNCKEFAIRYSIYHEYFHIFFIPFFPSGIKDGEGKCTKCNKRNSDKKEDYVSKTRTPIYFYSLWIIFLGLIIFIVLANLQTQKEKKLYVE